MEADGGTPPITLNYSTAPSRWRRRIRFIILFLIVSGLSIAAFRWGPTAWRQLQILYSQRQVMRYAAPSTMVVYEEDAAEAQKLLLKPGYAPVHLMKVPISGWGRPPGGAPINGPTSQPLPSTAAHRPEALDRFLAAGGLSMYLGPPIPAAAKIWVAMAPHPSRSAVAFVGALQTPSGRPRIVVVECFPQNDSGISFHSAIFVPAGMFAAPRVAFPSTIGRSPGGSVSRVFAGQVDPADPSHFSICYEGSGITGSMEGRITNQDTILWMEPDGTWH